MHPNSIISVLAYSNDQNHNSIAPTEIETDSLKLIASWKADFKKVHRSFSEVEDPESVFSKCGWKEHHNPKQTSEYIQIKKKEWENGERFEYLLIEKDTNEPIGTSYIQPHSEFTAHEFGIWMDKPYWGNEYSQERADAFVHLCFEELDAEFITVGCLETNNNSRKSIEKYIQRYNGSYYGSPPVRRARYHKPEGKENHIPHHEWMISKTQYNSEESGISTTIPDVSYEEVDFEN